MFDSKPSYKNPLAARIAESASLLESFATELIQKKQPRLTQVGKKLFRAMFPILDLVDGISELLKQKGMQGDGSPEEKAAQLLISLIEDVHQFTSEYSNEKLNTNDKLPTIYEEPIDRADVVNAVERSSNVTDLFKDIIENDPALAGIFKIIIPDNFECQSSNALEKLKEFLKDYQTGIKNRVNKDIPEYMFQLKGDRWEIRFEGEIFHLKKIVGLKHIHSLLMNPSKPIRSDHLQYGKIPNKKMVSQEDTDKKKKEAEVLIQFRPQFSYTDYSNAIRSLETELDQLELGSKEYLSKEDEIEHVKKERSRNFNWRGKERPHDSGEKARQAVSKSIANAKEKINKDIPELVIHLTNYLHPGYECIYDPPPSELKSWHL